MNELTQKSIETWVNGQTVTRVIDGCKCEETVKESDMVFVLQKVSATQYKLIGTR